MASASRSSLFKWKAEGSWCLRAPLVVGCVSVPCQGKTVTELRLVRNGEQNCGDGFNWNRCVSACSTPDRIYSDQRRREDFPQYDEMLWKDPEPCGATNRERLAL